MGPRRTRRRAPASSAAQTLVAITAPQLRDRVAQCLRAISEPYEVLECGRPWTVRARTHLVIADAGTLAKRDLPDCPTIVICAGLTVPDVMLAAVEEGGGSLLRAARLTPASLFAQLFQASRASRHGIEAHLVSLLPRTDFTAAVVRLFAETPSRTLRAQELQQGLGLPAAATGRLVRELGFHRAEHVTTYMQAESWIWFIRRGLNRRVVEQLLGIRDRSNFRRACQRARIEPPWHLPRTA